MKLEMSTELRLPKISMLAWGIIIIVFAILGFFHVNNTVVPEIENETAKYQRENVTLSTTADNLRTLLESKDYYEAETIRLHEEAEKVLLEYPTFMYLEDKILYADNLQHGDFDGYNVTNFAYGESRFVTSAYYGVEASAEGGGNLLELHAVALSARYTDLTYKKVKYLVDYGNHSEQRFVLNNIQMSYNDKTGYISGELSFTTYFIPGQTEPYVFPQEVIDNLGKTNRIDNLFGARLD